jgi:hypothetical protein
MLNAQMIVKAFWINLILDVDTGGPSTFKHSYDVDVVGGLSVAGTGIDDYGRIHRASHTSSYFCMVFQANYRFGHAQASTCGIPGHRDTSESRPLRDSGRNGVVRPPIDNLRVTNHVSQEGDHSFQV